MSRLEEAMGFPDRARSVAHRFARQIDELFEGGNDDPNAGVADALCPLDLRRPAELRGSGLDPEVSAALASDHNPGNPIREFVGHDGWVRCLAMADDGRHLVSGSTDGTVRLWDLESGNLCASFEVDSTSVRAIAVTKSGMIFTAVRGRVLSRFNPRRNDGATAPGELLLRHSSELRSLVLTSDGSLTILASDDDLRLWPTARSSDDYEQANGHTDSVSSVAITPDNRRFVTGSEDTTVGIWNLEQRDRDGVVHAFASGHRMWVNDVAITDDGDTVASVDEGGELRIWDVSYSPISDPIATGLGALSCVEFSTDERLVFVGADNGFVVAFDRETGATVGGCRVHDHQVIALTVLPDNLHFATGSADRSVKVWRYDDLT